MSHSNHKIIELNNLRLKYPGSADLQFEGLDLSIERGEKVLLLGPSGCGKSTLLQLMSGIIPKSYEVPFKAENIVIPEKNGVVFQDPDTQFCMPFMDEELAFGLENYQCPPEEMSERIQELLKSVGLDHLPSHTLISSLSGGMKQRLSTAAVLSTNPEVIFLDEPTAMIDEEGTIELWQLMKQVTSKKTVVIVEHKIEHILDFVDRIILMNEDGEIVESEIRPHELHLYQAQLQKYGIWHSTVWEDYIKTKQPSKLCSSTPIISLKDFRGFRKKVEKIHVTEEQVNKSEWIAVTGKNGAGKSTFFHSLLKLIPTKGYYELAGTTHHKKKDLPQLISFVFQNPEYQFITHTVWDEMAFRFKQPLATKEKEAIQSLLRQFGLEGMEKQHPYQLSMGQKKRLSIASSLVHKPSILLLDEPTFGQDANNTFMILETLEELRHHGTTILMITHDRHIVKHFADREWKIDEGKLIGGETHGLDT
ncbi:ATP-binding cassette domain-containing protein [Bacillus spongiae]|uniref:ATP-binding cassette domain-containing protein n=1 Tax=Bacillus spongiae TaxID=2683610 RepID=A0ABU8HBY2_9BACI